MSRPRKTSSVGKMRLNGSVVADDHVFQVVVLGASGGPREDTATGLLVRSIATGWSKGSVVAVDAGTLLAGIIRVLETDASVELVPESHAHSHGQRHGQGQRRILSSGPFAGLELPHITPEANAAHFFRNVLAGVLITHPHLDHVSGLALNTPLVEAESGPKTVAALPSTIAALKNHLFNDITWPNLSDEDGGAGLITYQRLVDGGNLRLGRGTAKGYIKAGEGLMTKCLGVSHGRCKQRYNPETEKHHRAESTAFMTEPLLLPSRRVSIDAASFKSYSPTAQENAHAIYASTESSAFFIRDDATGSEIIIFGDIEPDSISLDPRNERVWEAAAPKISDGSLRAIFIECSYSDAVEDSALYGHLCPRHLIAELEVLASKVLDSQKPSKGDLRKRKRTSSTGLGEQSSIPLSPKTKESTASLSAPPLPQLRADGDPPSGHNTRHASDRLDSSVAYTIAQKVSDSASADNTVTKATTTTTTTDGRTRFRTSVGGTARPLPLHGLTVYIIHVKDTLSDEGSPRELIILELRQLGEEAGLGCDFYSPASGEGVFI